MNFPSRIARDKLLCSSLQIPSSVCCTCYLLFLTYPPSLPFPISIKNSIFTNGKNARVDSDETQAANAGNQRLQQEIIFKYHSMHYSVMTSWAGSFKKLGLDNPGLE